MRPDNSHKILMEMTMRNFSNWLAPLGGLVLVFALGSAYSHPSIVSAAKFSEFVQLIAPTPFLHPPYYGTTRVNCVFDHQLPIYLREYPFGDPISSTVMHYDGTTASSPVVIGTTSCYSGHSGIDYGLGYQQVLAAADGTVI